MTGLKGEHAATAWDVNEAEGTTVPLVCREHVSGKRSMVGTYHIASLGTTQGQHLGFEEANSYLAAAWAPGLAPELVLAHKWHVGDLVAWSNRLVIHTATSTAPYDGISERLHTRIRMRSMPEYAPKPWKQPSHPR